LKKEASRPAATNFLQQQAKEAIEMEWRKEEPEAAVTLATAYCPASEKIHLTCAERARIRRQPSHIP
jgi:hypothetical protein